MTAIASYAAVAAVPKDAATASAAAAAAVAAACRRRAASKKVTAAVVACSERTVARPYPCLPCPECEAVSTINQKENWEGMMTKVVW
jgi:hypothetical protein